MNKDFDVIIMGAGLSGSSLALQLLKSKPEIKLLILDKKIFPTAEGFGTVGESTVEIASHYFSSVLGLKDHLESAQLPKLGLRYFLESEVKDAIEARLEVGGNRYAPTPTYQIDRARLENYILSEVKRLGGSLVDRAQIKSFSLEGDLKTINYLVDKRLIEATGSWIIDATGRTSLIKKKLNLKKKVEHKCSSVWWRLKGEHKIDNWSNEDCWRSRNTGEFLRWFSTNHLMGKGYWVWIIPLVCNATSFGIVFDSEIHKHEDLHTYEKALNWVRKNEPLLAKVLEENSESFQDFSSLKNYSYSVENVFSGEGWALTGEAGAFIDPLYSPGSDFIAISNFYITDLILRSLNKENINLRADIYNGIFLKFVDSTFNTFFQQYPILGNPKVLPVKVFWDWCFYWNFLSRLFFEEKLCDLRFLQLNKETFQEMEKLGIEMQALFRRWNETVRPKAKNGFLDLARHPYLFDLNKSLLDYDKSEDSQIRFDRGISDLKNIASEIRKIVSEDLSGITDLKEEDIKRPIIKPFFDDLREFLV